MQKKWLEIVKEEISQLDRIVIWGAGIQAKILIKILRYLKEESRIYAVVDSNYWNNSWGGAELEGIKIYAPQEINKQSGIVLVMCHDFFNVKKELEERKIDVYYKYDIYYIIEELFKRQMNFRYEKIECYDIPFMEWKVSLEKYTQEIEKVYKLLQDEASKKCLTARLELLKTGDYVDFYLNCPVVDADSKTYFAPELWASPLGGILVDCGGYIGDSALDFIECTNGDFQEVISFEPNKSNYMKYLQNVKDNRCIVYPYGVGMSGISTMNGEGEGAYIRQTEEVYDSIRVISLDDFLKEKPISIIKMDIEGSELSALKGAETLIKKYRPKLAICLYHKPNDIFEIPLYLKSLELGYTFRIRQHCFHKDKFDIRDTILYAEILGNE
jgi:FkbM family methyltransferase